VPRAPLPAVYNPSDERETYTFGAVEFALEPNAVNELKPPADRPDITAVALLAHVLQTRSIIGVREVKNPKDKKALKFIVIDAEQAHSYFLRSKLGNVLERHKKAQAEDVQKGLKPRPDTDEVKAARKVLKEWGLL